MKTSISMKTLISSALIVAFFAGFQGGRYFLKNRFQELGIAAALFLYVYGALHTGLTVKNIKWSWWFFMPPFLIFFIMLYPSIAFSINADTLFFPSIFASREFLLGFIAPAVYFLYRAGFELPQIEKTFVAVIVILLINYLFHYMRLDLEAAYFSDDPTIHHLITYDEWRGFRLKPPTYALMVVLLYSLLRFFQFESLAISVGCLIILGISGYIYSLVLARAALATLVLSILVYPICFSRANRINLVVLGLPVGFFVFYFIVGFIIQHFENADGGALRLESFKIAWNTFMDYFLFGYGQSSGHSKTYQEIFGGKFFPSDLGIIGMGFKYGITGICLYLYFIFYIFFRLLKANWLFRKLNRKHNPLIWALLIFFTAMITMVILQPGLAYAQGITVASFSIGYTACYFEEVSRL